MSLCSCEGPVQQIYQDGYARLHCLNVLKARHGLHYHIVQACAPIHVCGPRVHSLFAILFS